ncbi:hypothetical protein [Nocardioides sp. LML1-1-1.1]|uniref:hypothetical protein n=1 Tax=Nocardioides sp. LML1-1-1.1 TaxID=3135248 RepID=UPI00342381E5
MQPLRNVRTSRAGVSGLVVALLTIALILSMPGPARAATTYTPTGGAVSFVSSGLSFTDIEAAQTVSCGSLNLYGTVSSSGTSRAYGADMVALSQMGSGICNQSLCGPVTTTPVGTWTLAITGDWTSWSVWPARLKNVRLSLSCAGCTFRLTGVINGTFHTSTQRFAPVWGASGLVVDAAVPPSGAMCVTLDILAGDTIEVGGSWTSMSSSVAISNP